MVRRSTNHVSENRKGRNKNVNHEIHEAREGPIISSVCSFGTVREN